MLEGGLEALEQSLGISYAAGVASVLQASKGSKSSCDGCWIAKSWITCVNTNGNTTLSEAQGVSLRITSGVRFRRRPPAKGVGLRVADSHTGNHPEDDFTPLETIRRPYSVIRKRIPFELEGETFEPERGVRHQAPQSNVMYASMNALRSTQSANHSKAILNIQARVLVILPKKSETIYDAPLGFVGMYTHHFSLSNLRLPIPLFICDVLNYFKAYGGEPSVDLLRSFLNLGRAGDWLTLSNRGGADVPKALIKPVTHLENWKEMDFRSFMIQGVDGEFNFLLEGGFDDNQGSLSAKSVNNETPIIDAEPISTVLPSNVADNIIDSSNTSSDDELPLVHPSTSSFLEVGEKSKAAGKRKLAADALREGSHHRARKAPVQASKVAGDASTPLDVDSDPDIHGKFEPFPSARELKDATDCYWVVAHVTPPSWKHHLRDISIEQLCDIHDRAYMHQAVLDNMLNSTTQELISALHKAKASCNAIRDREIKRDKAYAELEKKCNESLQDLDKNPLVSDMRSEIETLQGQVNGLHNEYDMLLLKERKWASYEQTLSILHAKVECLESERERLKASEIQVFDEMGVLVARLVREAIIHGRCTTFEEVAKLKEPFVLEKMPEYRTSSKDEYDRAGEDMANASYLILSEFT
ncbi:hypothetical protein Tco_0819731 [Tanacetum coccineum]|uniref:Transposase (Putative), gypsy type n=1 Tax=Tanacetum coccineum TaxID=301880 RepID=A0ABQ5AA18_9ASTR